MRTTILTQQVSEHGHYQCWLYSHNNKITAKCLRTLMGDNAKNDSCQLAKFKNVRNHVPANSETRFDAMIGTDWPYNTHTERKTYLLEAHNSNFRRNSERRACNEHARGDSRQRLTSDTQKVSLILCLSARPDENCDFITDLMNDNNHIFGRVCSWLGLIAMNFMFALKQYAACIRLLHVKCPKVPWNLSCPANSVDSRQ